jgi:ESX secretion-associated protein EspG
VGAAPPPDVSNGAALQAERHAHAAADAAARGGRRVGGVGCTGSVGTMPVVLASFRPSGVKSTDGAKALQQVRATAAASPVSGVGPMGGGYGPMGALGRGDNSREYQSPLPAASLDDGGEAGASLSENGVPWLPAAQQSDAPFLVSEVSWGPNTSVFDELAVPDGLQALPYADGPRARTRTSVQSVGVTAGDRHRQGVDSMTRALSQSVALTADELEAMALRVGIRDLPTVLNVGLRHPTIETRDAALDKAIRSLVSRSLIVDGVVHPDLVPMLQTLHCPDRVLARRVGDDIDVKIVGSGIDVRTVASVLLAELPRAKAADVTPVGAPLREMPEKLSGTRDPLTLADRIRAVGADPQAAMLLGAALGSRQAHAEIVYYVLADDEGRISRGPAAVAVFYTKRGRIIAAPSVSPAGQTVDDAETGHRPRIRPGDRLPCRALRPQMGGI